MLPVALDDVTVHAEIVPEGGTDVVDVLVLGLDRCSLRECSHTRVRDAPKGLHALGEFVSRFLNVLVRFLEEEVDIEIFRPCDVPVMLVKLVVQDVGVREVRVQCIDDLFSFVLVKTDWVPFNSTGFLTDDPLCAHHRIDW